MKRAINTRLFLQEVFNLKHTYLYPEGIWQEFEELIYAWFPEDDLTILEDFYGKSQRRPINSHSRSILFKFAEEIKNSPIAQEVLEIGKMIDGVVDELKTKESFESHESLEMINGSLESYGLSYSPIHVRNVTFHTCVKDCAFFVWNWVELSIPDSYVEILSQTAEEIGIKKVFIITDCDFSFCPKNGGIDCVPLPNLWLQNRRVEIIENPILI